MPEISTSIPKNVYGVDLAKVSTVIGCSEDELVRGIHSCSSTVIDTEGAVVGKEFQVPFQQIERQDTFSVTTGVKQVLLTAAMMLNPSDSFGIPKCLMQLGDCTVLEHILSTLYGAGMERVVISIAHCGKEIIQLVVSHPTYHKMAIEFLDLGPQFRDGHARSILASKEFFTQPFLLHTSDHIFDGHLVAEIAQFDLNHAAACVLVERDVSGSHQVVSAIKVSLDQSTRLVRKIGRNVEEVDGIDAGLFLCHPCIFNTLETFAMQESYFAFADALNLYSSTDQLAYMDTEEKMWFSIETKEEFEFATDHKGDPILSPWTVYLARSSSPRIAAYSSSAPAASMIHSRNMVMGVPAPGKESTLRVLTNTRIRQSQVFSGFVVGVGHSRRSDLVQLEEQRPLLYHEDDDTDSRPRLSDETIDDPFVVAIPVPEHDSNQGHEAFLVEMSPETIENNLFLAVAETTPMMKKRHTRHTLPSDVTSVKVETLGPEFGVQVVVDRRVPMIGFVLLGTALLAISSVGVATNMQLHVNPAVKLFCRMSATFLALLPLALRVLRRDGWPPLSKTD